LSFVPFLSRKIQVAFLENSLFLVKEKISDETPMLLYFGVGVNVIILFCVIRSMEKNFPYLQTGRVKAQHSHLKAFSLLELLAVIAILLLLVVICLPGYRYCLIKAKVVAGKPLSRAEKLFVLKHYPDLAETYGITVEKEEKEEEK
jgi:prepilin-type N-terminal cleavage/methylation domain-containing protein